MADYTLGAAMLDVARLLGGLRSGVATGGSTSTLIDTSRREEAEFWKNGTLWITSGIHAGKCFVVKSFSGNTITIPTTLTGTIAAGMEYAVLPQEFPMDIIRHSVQSSLNELGDIVSSDITLTTDPDDEAYELPDGVYNVLRVEIATNDADPYGYAPNYFWKELSGWLYFIPEKKPGTDGFKMRIWYKAPHAEVFDYSDVVSPSVDRGWLAWAGVVHVLRNSLGIKGKDKAISIDLLNQALQKENEYRQRQRKNNMLIISRDPILNP